VNILNMAVTLVVVALPKGDRPAHSNILELTSCLRTGLPLAITLALVYVTEQMSKENILVRALGSCETIANATVICTDTGTLTQNEMTVVAGIVGVHVKFKRMLEERRERADGDARNGPNARDFDVDLVNINTVLSRPLKGLFNAAIALNSTAFEDLDPESGVPVFIGSTTESALLGFAKELGWPNYKDTRGSADIVHMIPFYSYRKFMGCVVRLPDGSHRLYVKGASEILARNCTRHVVVGDAAPSANEAETAPIGALEQHIISRAITSYASQSLRTIALCYRDLPSWPPRGAHLWGNDEASKLFPVQSL
jgi:Ca2+-transporting ATPase